MGTYSCEDSSDIWLQDVSFSRGESVLIEAASGRGKSSLCAFLSGLRSDYEGSITYCTDGVEVFCTPTQLLREHVAMLFQDHRLFGELTAMQNVMLKNQLTGFVTQADAHQMLVRLGLSDRLDRPCSQLSLGQQQRVALVRALCQPCDFLLLDEPVSHLDADTAAEMSALMREKQQQLGFGLVVTSIGQRLPYSYDKVLKL